jgi:hypothetical protein
LGRCRPIWISLFIRHRPVAQGEEQYRAAYVEGLRTLLDALAKRDSQPAILAGPD